MPGKIFVAGHRGLAGSAIVRKLKAEGEESLVLRTSSELDLRDGAKVRAFFESERPDYVYLAAAKVGGIVANDEGRADFIYDNLLIQTHVIDAAYRSGAKKLLFLGSSCIYPKFAPQPMKEEHLLTGTLEPTNDAYAIAKIAGITMAQAYQRQHGFRAISLMPTNLYGPGDNFDLRTSHVLPALMRKFHEAKIADANEVVVWGTGSPKREFLHVDDLADACVYLMKHYDDPAIVNIGWGSDLSIGELAGKVANVVGFQGKLVFDTTKPDGTPRKLLDTTKLTGLGWKPRIALDEGLASTYSWYVENVYGAR